MIDFDTLQTALDKLGASVEAAETHGALCGLLLDQADMATWLKHILNDLPEPGDRLAAEQLARLKQLFEDCQHQLNTEDMSFDLLLPDEQEDLSQRLPGLATWCQGFLYAVGVTGIGNSKDLDALSQECLSDLLEISKLDHRSDESDEAAQQYLEIVEHVRMSVLILNESLNPVMPAPPVQ